MGFHPNIYSDKFPKQSNVGEVDSGGALILRHDEEEPFRTITQLPDGRVLLKGESSEGAAPESGDFLGKEVQVIFRYNTVERFPGVVIRDDRAEPFRTVIKLKDGRVVLATECQYTWG